MVCVEFDLHCEFVWLMTRKSFYCRKQILEEFAKINEPMSRERKVFFHLHESVFFIQNGLVLKNRLSKK